LPSPLPKKVHHIASGLENHASERSTYFYAYHYVDAGPSLRPSPASGTLTSRALLAQASHKRMTSVGCRHPPRIYVFTRIFGRYKPIYICQSGPTNCTIPHRREVMQQQCGLSPPLLSYLSGFVYLCFCVLIYCPLSEIFVLTTAFLGVLFATFVRNMIDLVFTALR